MYARHTPGIGETAGGLFRRFPIGCPLAFISVGVLISVLTLSVERTQQHGPHSPLLLPFGVMVVVIGLIILPFGVVTAVRRRRAVIVLKCPSCGAESRSSERPFKVQRWNDVPYTSVVCSRCGKDFTVDKWARLE
jgi:hypothetical protein